jgi:hypothetical protein
MRRRFTIAAAVLALTLLLQTATFACPGCIEATSDQSLNLARGFSYSILFMMPIPFIIVGSFGGYVYYTMRRRDVESAETKTPDDKTSPNA